MNRLTRKSEHNINGYVYLEKQERIGKNPALVKLGQLEDLMEKYEINSIEELKESLKVNQKLKSNLARWLALLETDGIDSKNMVATDIQCLLKQLNDDTIKQSEGGKQ